MALADDESAVDSLPIALAGAVLLTAIITALCLYGLHNASPAVQTASVDRQAGTLASDCRFLLSMAPRSLEDAGSPPGAEKAVELDLPEGTEYLSFGYDPEAGDSHAGTIYYKVCGSKKAIVVDERAIFKSADGSQTVLRSGKYALDIEYARDALGRRYLLVSGAQA